MPIDYTRFNLCITCHAKYSKDTKYCPDCKHILRTKSHIIKAEVRERTRKLYNKRY